MKSLALLTFALFGFLALVSTLPLHDPVYDPSAHVDRPLPVYKADKAKDLQQRSYDI